MESKRAFIGTNAAMKVYPWESRLELTVAASRAGFAKGGHTINSGRGAAGGDSAALICEAYDTQMYGLFELLRTKCAALTARHETNCRDHSLLDALFRSSYAGWIYRRSETALCNYYYYYYYYYYVVHQRSGSR
ncbi:hypothetical protein BSZ19_09280 [Bradyrhizobium japonicum]|uniref:Uncharacterized protein n=1 Tax=Bradyrhizobium japonicum TaxID=375 RepID=A0A1Y2JTS7_BRAJP|nr:hypothetical protein [Bradyrhizobium japonicum]OSJ35201.1 hypothetical protein BSZ19_09280 [Bradyrhizobium japonicum]